MNASEYRGGCLCGNIRFIATGIPDNLHTCSCTMCQKQQEDSGIHSKMI
ncbi:GFA family protein [Xenorhabdus cabanillasii]